MKQRGFTLTELLIVLAMAAILVAIAVPSYGFLVTSGRLASATNDMLLALHLARSEAIKRGTRVTVCKTSNPGAPTPTCDQAADWHQGWLVFVDGGVRGVVDGGDAILQVYGDISAWASITTGGNYRRYVSYMPMGTSQGSSGLHNDTFEICVSGMRRDIIVNTVGRPRLRSGSC
jgi:type IV fimbrial biogenesis protein FimT